MNIAGDYENTPLWVADWPHCCDFKGGSCDGLRCAAMPLDPSKSQQNALITACGLVRGARCDRVLVTRKCQTHFFGRRKLSTYYDSPMSNVQAVYLIIVDPDPQEGIRSFSVVVLTSEPGRRAHYCSIPNGPSTLSEYNPSCSCSVD